MNFAIETHNLGKRYGRDWALQDCSFGLPAGRIAGLVGPNGAGKSTLMGLLVGLLEPSAGRAEVFGISPQEKPEAVLAKVGFVSQDRPLFRDFSVRDLLTFGRKLNHRFDDDLARHRLEQLRIPFNRPAGKLSGGQQAQVALVLALAKRPDLLILDEPVGSLDPLARHEFLQLLIATVAENGQTVLISSHQVADLDRICNFLIVVSGSRLLLADDLVALLDSHCWVTCSPADAQVLAGNYNLVKADHGDRSSRLLLRDVHPGEIDDRYASLEQVSLDDLVLAYLALPVQAPVEMDLRPLEAVR